jgi:triacylglycerol lipase
MGNWVSSALRLKVLVAVLAVLTLLTACATIPGSELAQIGAKITPASIDFSDLYAYAERSKTAYGSEAAIRKGYPATVRVGAPAGTDVQYFLERDDKRRVQFITVRGTINQKNWSEDFDSVIRRDRRLDIPVHAGFDAIAAAINTDVKPYLKPGYATYVTGHSLGGAAAALLAIYLMEDGVYVKRVVTFGQPKFTTSAGVPRLSGLPILRIVDENDIVPMVPPASEVLDPTGPYEHVGPEVILLEGPRYTYLPSHDATRISLGEFWRSIGLADVKDHKMDKYLARLSDKKANAVQVDYNDRERYVAHVGLARPRQ